MDGNNRTDFSILSEFKCLETLILDNNRITSLVKFSRQLTLETLWMNNNKIDNLITITNKLVGAFPKLKMFSMLNNPACPNFFNGGTPSQYKDYRMYMLSRIPALQVLDSQPVQADERDEARQKYGDKAVRYGVYLHNDSTPELVMQSSAVKQRLASQEQRAPADGNGNGPDDSVSAVLVKPAAASRRRAAKSKKKAPQTSAPDSLAVPSLDELEYVEKPPLLPPDVVQAATLHEDMLPSLENLEQRGHGPVFHPSTDSFSSSSSSDDDDDVF